jgi:hypothetical protein
MIMAYLKVINVSLVRMDVQSKINLNVRFKPAGIRIECLECVENKTLRH